MPRAQPLSLGDLEAIGVERLKGVGTKRRAALAEVGVTSVADLLTYYPRRYIDRSREMNVADMDEGHEAVILGRVTRIDSRRTRNGRTIVVATVTDGSGQLKITFFNQPWRARQLPEGTEAAFFGKVDLYRGAKQMANPIVDLIGDRTGRIVPIYPQSDKAGLMTWEISACVAEALRRCAERTVSDPLPDFVRSRWGLCSRHDAMMLIHQPETMQDVHRARTRLVFDELFRIQLTLLRRKLQIEATSSGIAHETVGGLLDRFERLLDLDLTAAQRRTMAEIDKDLGRCTPMHRLLQGDVGAGKTLVAVHALLVGIQGGHQGAMMAPTEVLAEQHAFGIREMLTQLEVDDDRTLVGSRPLRVELLTNGVPAADRRRILAGLVAGEVDLVIGTHALIQEGVSFASLGVVVVDEQHRFGVEQRDRLRDRGRVDGRVPDLLVMTATPIPRTAAMTVYGDLDVSVLDELPPGRSPIATRRVRDETEASQMWDDVRAHVGDGRQVYVVCPLIEESEKLDARSAQETFDRLRSGELSGLRVGLLHGRLSGKEKEATMSLFRSGEIDCLVATTVIEVGVDVTNATVMVVESADRFGMAQLHQLRGRVGRGAHPSVCYLVSAEEITPDGDARLDAVAATTDGFKLAEVDLELRGEGTIFDQRQSGRNDLKLASLRKDKDWVVRAREAAAKTLDGDADLAEQPGLADELEWFLAGRDDGDYLLKG